MITTTTPSVEGKTIQQYFGVVSAEVIIGANIFKDILGGLRDIIGGRSGTYERVLDEARINALNELIQKSNRFGANAIVGIDFDYETIGARGSMLMVSATGTAVRIN
ncbi:MAG: heavy metal-binding domain-containing protein [Chitinophagaceae bacterium]|nr:heavy metal-binding domain-containing protein [Chitinophagaceae bacterium]